MSELVSEGGRKRVKIESKRERGREREIDR